LPNIASVLKEEIARLVRRELRGETESLKKASSRYRSDIAALKRRIEALEKQISRLERMVPKKAAPVVDGESETKLRFKPQGVRAQRTRLGLSARRWARSWASPPKPSTTGKPERRAQGPSSSPSSRPSGRWASARSRHGLTRCKRIDGPANAAPAALRRTGTAHILKDIFAGWTI
jgi:hypothetical protein